MSYFHVFSHSERENTEAFQKNGFLPKKISHKRNKILRSLSEIKRNKFYDSQIGTEHSVLSSLKIEKDFYMVLQIIIRVKITVNEVIPNSLQNVKLKTKDTNGIMLKLHQ